jgi:hypothetical protein
MRHTLKYPVHVLKYPVHTLKYPGHLLKYAAHVKISDTHVKISGTHVKISGSYVQIFADSIRRDAKFLTPRDKSQYIELAKAYLFISRTKRLHKVMSQQQCRWF